MTSLSINELQKSFKKEPKNSQIYLDVIDKLSTFAPALLERQSLMIDILLMILPFLCSFCGHKYPGASACSEPK